MLVSAVGLWPVLGSSPLTVVTGRGQIVRRKIVRRKFSIRYQLCITV